MASRSGRRRVVVLAVAVLVVAAAGAGLYFQRVSGHAGAGQAVAAMDGGAGSSASPSPGGGADGAQAAEGDADGGASPPKDAAPPKNGDAEKKDGDGKGENGKGKTPVPVSVASIATGPVSSYISSTANLVAENEVKVLAEAEGRVAELRVEEGDRVAKDQVLASLARDDAEILFRKAQLKAANARLNHERADRVFSESLMSREEFDRLKLEREVADQELAEAAWKLEKTTIKAPFAGRITERSLRVGQHVRPGDSLFTLADFDPLIAWIYLPEKEVYGLAPGRDVRITPKAAESSRFAGRIRQISPVVDTATGTVKVTVEAVAPPPDVRPGSFVTIDVVRETHHRAVLLPRQAVIRELQDAYVFVAEGDVARKRAVALGLEEGEHVEAVSGVAEGDAVIVAGQGGLKDGAPIKVIAAPKASEVIAQNDRLGRG